MFGDPLCPPGCAWNISYNGSKLSVSCGVISISHICGELQFTCMDSDDSRTLSLSSRDIQSLFRINSGSNRIITHLGDPPRLCVPPSPTTVYVYMVIQLYLTNGWSYGYSDFRFGLTMEHYVRIYIQYVLSTIIPRVGSLNLGRGLAYDGTLKTYGVLTSCETNSLMRFTHNTMTFWCFRVFGVCNSGLKSSFLFGYITSKKV